MKSCRTGVQQECQEDLVSVHTRSSAKQLLDRGHFCPSLSLDPAKPKGYLPVSCSTHRHAQKHKETSGAPGLLGYWAIGLLGYWATGLLGNRTKCRQKKVRVFFNVSGDSHLPRAKKSLEKHFTRILLLQSLENLCVLAVFSCFCASNGTRGRLFPLYPLAFPIADCFRFLPFLFLKGFFWLPTSTVPRAVVVADVLSQTPPLSWY